MSNFLFENVLLNVNLQSTASLVEWEGSSLTIKVSALSTLSFEFFFSYFNFFSAALVTTPLVAAEFDAYCHNFSTLKGASNLYAQLHTAQWLLAGSSLSASSHLLNYRDFSNNALLANLFQGTLMSQLYCDFTLFFLGVHAVIFYPGTYVSSLVVATNWLFELSYSADWLLIIVECLALLALLNYAARVVDLFANIQIFYDDIVTFCKLNNVSIAEVGVFFSFFLGFIVFDIFICSSDEDVTDVFSYFMVTFVILLFFFLILGVDVQYYYMISSVSSGDLTARVIAFDVINNFLCILRIFFCWVRYIFYDMQVELVDFSFHYTDAVNDLTIISLYDNASSSAWFGDFFTVYSDSSVLSVTRTTWWLFIYVYIDICFVILQMLLGFVKLFIAFFLLWLIVDLFILKAFAHSESTRFSALRNK